MHKGLRNRFWKNQNPTPDAVLADPNYWGDFDPDFIAPEVILPIHTIVKPAKRANRMNRSEQARSERRISRSKREETQRDEFKRAKRLKIAGRHSLATKVGRVAALIRT